MSFLLSFSLTLNVSTWTAAKNEVFKGLSFMLMGFLVLSNIYTNTTNYKTN